MKTKKDEGNVVVYGMLQSPVGRLMVVVRGGALVRLEMATHRRPVAIRADWRQDEADPVVAETRRQLGEYFAGERVRFELPLAAEGSAWESRVWEELIRIPAGETRTYGQLAKRVGRPTAARAVGLANGRNPIAIVVPCHRVIGADGTLTGYAGGLEMKRWLLAHERRMSA